MYTRTIWWDRLLASLTRVARTCSKAAAAAAAAAAIVSAAAEVGTGTQEGGCWGKERKDGNGWNADMEKYAGA